MAEFEVSYTETVTFEGTIVVCADDAEEAEDIVNGMDVQERFEHGDILDSSLSINEVENY